MESNTEWLNFVDYHCRLVCLYKTDNNQNIAYINHDHLQQRTWSLIGKKDIMLYT